MNAQRRCRLVLIGMMGSGKSTIGTLLSSRTGWPYHDNDALVGRLRGETAREVLAGSGEAELRRTEAQALQLGLTQPAPCVLGAAAGTVLDEQARRDMRERALVVWLDASPRTLAQRARNSLHRPWLGTDAEGWMRRTLSERAPLYKSVADLIVNTQRRRPASIVTEIIDWLGDQPECMRLVDAPPTASPKDA